MVIESTSKETVLGAVPVEVFDRPFTRGNFERRITGFEK